MAVSLSCPPPPPRAPGRPEDASAALVLPLGNTGQQGVPAAASAWGLVLGPGFPRVQRRDAGHWALLPPEAQCSPRIGASGLLKHSQGHAILEQQPHGGTHLSAFLTEHWWPLLDGSLCRRAQSFFFLL